MAKHSMPEMKEGSVNVTPLIDVVMCLIIFFMLVAKIGVATGASPMPLPETILGKKIEELGNSMILNVLDPNFKRDDKGLRIKDDRGGFVRADGTPPQPHLPVVSGLLDEKDKDPKQIFLVHPTRNDYPLRALLAEAVKKNKDFSVTIRAEKDLEFGKLQVVLQEIAQAGVRNVNYAAKAKVE